MDDSIIVNEINKNLTIENAKYYDHALNSGPAVAVAIARARREVKEEGRAYTVIACWPGKEPFYWDGCFYDALGLAKSLHFSKAEVRLISPAGGDIDIENARY